MQWDDICFKTNTITVNRTRDKYGTRTPKSKKSYRTIKIDDILITQLKSYYLWCKKIKLSLGLHLQENDLVFITNTGSPCNDSTLNKAFESLFDGLEIKRITPHGLRHTHATILIEKRIPVIEIAQRLGNTPQMIYNVYGHSFDKIENESVQAFSESVNSKAIQ